MESPTAVRSPVAVPPAPPGPSPAPLRPPPDLVEWKGRIPRSLASFLERLAPSELLDLYGLIGRFAEVRQLVSIARRVHQILERGPHTAASGRWSFAEFMACKDEIARMIHELAGRVALAADDARIAFPRIPAPGRRISAHAPTAA